jgi:beta-glucosidase
MTSGVTAILACGYPAQSTGEALYRSFTLSDPAAAPAARLPSTWPANLNQIPEMTNYTMEGRTYRYYRGDPLYPFGYGLSYSSFVYTKLTISPSVITEGSDANVEVCLRNEGPHDSAEVCKLSEILYYPFVVVTTGCSSVHVLASCFIYSA